MMVPTNKNQNFLEKWQIPDLGQELYNVSLGKLSKTTGVTWKGPRINAEGFQWPKMGQCERWKSNDNGLKHKHIKIYAFLITLSRDF